MTRQETTIGVLALQGAFIEHIQHLELAVNSSAYDSIDFDFIEVRTETELSRCDGLIIPGGESTSISLIAQRTNLLEPLMRFVKDEKPIWGTCAGLIFLSKQIINGKPGQAILGGMDIQVERNAFGRQLDSFKVDLDFSGFTSNKVDAFPTIFIRAPVISKILAHKGQQERDVINSRNDYINNSKVEVLYKLENGLIVAVRQGNKLGTSFHPELSHDCRFHKWFIDEFVLKSQSTV
ncbi:SNO glutamine amidotransferase [Nadsonia fulvescens var. elongata DSM 6958]|uniref:glutaminase n=1 Tax=Nadsonia fulvescens var. elongata DSM 6958 TaxID=857566 RepID=A0A1E3PN70_9ASCO|nr:SNO glutamine amidotransferase [Nadsonia fulvescens var. elongata DSM 6958]